MNSQSPPRMNARDILDAYFLETRAKLLEIRRESGSGKFDRAWRMRRRHLRMIRV